MTPHPNNLASIGLAEKSAAVSALVANRDMKPGAGNSSLNLSETELARITAYVHGIMRWSGAGSVKTERERV